MVRHTETPFPNLTALVVDDNAFVCKMMSEVLKSLGAKEVRTADGSTKAFEILRSWLPKVILVDYNMKPKSGIEVAKTIRNQQDDQVRRIPLLMISGEVNKSLIVEARDAGIEGFVAKPVTTKALADRLYDAIHSQRRFIISSTYVGPDRRRREKANYQGPWRRLSDPVFIAERTDEERVAAEILRMDLGNLRKLIGKGKILNPYYIKAMYVRLCQVGEFCQHAGEPTASRMLDSLRTYIEGIGREGEAEIKVINNHLDAVFLALETEGPSPTDQIVIDELQGLVQRKLAKAS